MSRDAMVDELEQERRTLQDMGTGLIRGLFPLSRSVTLYEPNNATVVNQVQLLAKRVESAFQEFPDGIRLQLLEDEFFVNGRLLRTDPRFFERAVVLAEFMHQFDLGEICFDPGVNEEHLSAFVGDLSASAKARQNMIPPQGYGPLQVGEGSGRSLASFQFNPDRLAILLCGSLLDLMEWLYTSKNRRISLLPLRRTVQLVIDAVSQDVAYFQIVAAIRDPARPMSAVRSRLAATIDTIGFAHYLTLHRRDVMYLALAAILGGIDESRDPERAVQPLFGFRGLREASMPMVLAVHDSRRIRNGEPGGVAGQILAVCETYHDLTSANQERPAMAPHEALQQMLDGVFPSLDRATVRTFADFKGPYPLGSAVTLNNGATAVVVGHGTSDATKNRPTVLLYDGTRMYGEPIDLAVQDEVAIVGTPAPADVLLNLAPP